MSLPALYAAATTLAAPALRLMLRRRALRGKEIPDRLEERRGIEATPRPAGRLLWLHAASVGETVSILPLLASLPPGISVLLSTGTVTSAALLAARLPQMALAVPVLHRFVPLDVPAWCARFLDHWRPDAAGFVESEIWPNLLGGCARRRIPVALVNGRMSARSFARWRRLPGFARWLFGAFAAVHAQSAGDAARLGRLGAPAAALVGNLKFAAAELPFDAGELARLRGVLAGRPVWLAASTHPGEEGLMLEAHALLLADFPDLLTIIVPRHPERGAEILALAAPYSATRRAVGEDPPAGAGVWIADTLGELGLLYRLVGHAFIGKSLGAQGGQNPLEPARLGCAVASGPHMGNFADITAVLEAAGALRKVPDVAALAGWVGEMLRDGAARAAIGEAGRRASRQAAELPGAVAAMLMRLMPA